MSLGDILASYEKIESTDALHRYLLVEVDQDTYATTAQFRAAHDVSVDATLVHPDIPETEGYTHIATIHASDAPAPADDESLVAIADAGQEPPPAVTIATPPNVVSVYHIHRISR